MDWSCATGSPEADFRSCQPRRRPVGATAPAPPRLPPQASMRRPCQPRQHRPTAPRVTLSSRRPRRERCAGATRHRLLRAQRARRPADRSEENLTRYRRNLRIDGYGFTDLRIYGFKKCNALRIVRTQLSTRKYVDPLIRMSISECVGDRTRLRGGQRCRTAEGGG